MTELWRRVLVPLAVPLAALAVITFVVLDLSRILLALGGAAAAVVGAGTAGAVVFSAMTFSRRPATESRVPFGFLALATAALAAGGLVGFARLDEEQRQAHAAAPGAGQRPPDAVITAFDLGFRPSQFTVEAGTVRIAYVDDGLLAHTLVIDGAPRFKRLEVNGKGERADGSATLEPGTYTFFCDIPGHRQAGMEGTLVVEAAAAGDNRTTGNS